MLRRPLTKLALATSAAHLVYELGAQVGLPGAAAGGIVPVGSAFGGATVWAWRRADQTPHGDRGVASVDALLAAAAVAHLTGWPRQRGPLGLPVLVECEGMGPELMGPYNAILYTSGVAALAALMAEGAGAASGPALVGAAAVPVLVVLQRFDHRVRERRARERPRWWNRRLRDDAATVG